MKGELQSNFSMIGTIMLFLKSRAIAVLLGRESIDMINVDAARFHWRKMGRPGSRGRYLCLADVERSYGLTFSAAQIAAACEATADPSFIDIREEDTTAHG